MPMYVRRVQIDRTTFLGPVAALRVRGHRPSAPVLRERTAPVRMKRDVSVRSRRLMVGPRRGVVRAIDVIHRWRESVAVLVLMSVRMDERRIHDRVLLLDAEGSAIRRPGGAVREAPTVPLRLRSAETSEYRGVRGILPAATFQRASARHDIPAAERIVDRDLLYRAGENKRSTKRTSICFRQPVPLWKYAS